VVAFRQGVGLNDGKLQPGSEPLNPSERSDDVTARRLPFVWDYDIDEDRFRRLLAGEETLGRLDRDWAAVRLIEYAPYRDIIRLLGFRSLVEGWPKWGPRIRSQSRKRGLDFLVEWLPRHHPELL